MVDTKAKDAEGASLGQAKPDETLRQKDPVPNHSGKFLCVKSSIAKDTDGATHHWLGLSMRISQVQLQRRAIHFVRL
jgi:hypothetical protein